MNLAGEIPLNLTPKDEEILKTIYTYRYTTTLDIAHLLFRPTYLPYVRSRLARLAGGKDLQENTYLCRFKLPATEGNRERIFTLGNKGRAFLKDTHGCVLDFPIGGFSPPEGRLARGFKPPAFSRFLFQSAVKSAESF
jgi:hypothetical protein